MLPVATRLLERSGRGVQIDSVLLSRCRRYKHGWPVLECAGYAWHPGVVREPGVAVSRRQGRVEEGLLSRVVSLRLVLLRLGERGSRSRGGGIPTAKFCDVT